jgi:hypothetical protein
MTKRIAVLVAAVSMSACGGPDEAQMQCSPSGMTETCNIQACSDGTNSHYLLNGLGV